MFDYMSDVESIYGNTLPVSWFKGRFFPPRSVFSDTVGRCLLSSVTGKLLRRHLLLCCGSNVTNVQSIRWTSQIKHCQQRKLINPRKVARTVEQSSRQYSIHVIRGVAYFHHQFPLKNEVCLFKLMARSGGTTCRSVNKNFPVYCAETYR